MFEVNKDITYATRTVTFESQKKQVQQVAVNPMTQWKIQCRGTDEQRKTLESFHARCGGNTRVFYFYDENMDQRTVRFAEPKLSTKVIRDFSDANVTNGTVVGFTAEITLEVAL